MNRRAVRSICFCIFMACILYLGIYYLGSTSAEKGYSSIRDIKNKKLTEAAQHTPTTAPTSTATPTATMTPSATPSASPSPTLSPTPSPSPTPTPMVILNQYEDLYNQNNDFAAWINIPGTNIDYPVMYIKGDVTEFYYLWRNFNKRGGKTQAEANAAYAGNAGSLFIDGRNDLDPDRSDNIIIYGHNMKAGTMFAQLMKYTDKSFYETHKYIQFDTIYSEDTYEIVAVIKSWVENAPEGYFKFYNYVNFKNQATFNYYMDNIYQMALYDTGVKAEYGDELITLVTCRNSWEHDYDRLAVIAKRITKDE